MITLTQYRELMRHGPHAVVEPSVALGLLRQLMEETANSGRVAELLGAGGHPVFQCGDCGNWEFDAFGLTVSGGDAVCRDCATRYIACDECSENYHRNDISTAFRVRGFGGLSSRLVCAECLEELYSYRECCSEWIADGHDCGCDRDEDDDTTSGLLDNQANPLRVIGKRYCIAAGEKRKMTAGVDRTLYLGVELEVEARGSLDHAVNLTAKALKDVAILKSDGSLSSRGFEIASLPGTRAWHETAWNSFFSTAAPEVRGWDGQNCGMHVHVSRAAISHLTIGKIVAFITAPANRSFINRVAGRDEGQYCMRLPKKVTDPHFRGDSDRYQAVNLASPHGTYEIRIFRSNVSRGGFFKNLDFVVALVEFAQATPINRLRVADFIRWFQHPSNRSRFQYLGKWMRDRGIAKVHVRMDDAAAAEIKDAA